MGVRQDSPARFTQPECNQLSCTQQLCDQRRAVMTSVNVDAASRTRVVVRGSFALIVLGQVLVAACGWFFHEVLSRLRPSEVLAPWPFLPYCAAFVAAMLLATAVHEGGHVVVGRRFGWRLARISVALRVGVLTMTTRRPIANSSPSRQRGQSERSSTGSPWAVWRCCSVQVQHLSSLWPGSASWRGRGSW